MQTNSSSRSLWAIISDIMPDLIALKRRISRLKDGWSTENGPQNALVGKSKIVCYFLFLTLFKNLLFPVHSEQQPNRNFTCMQV